MYPTPSMMTAASSAAPVDTANMAAAVNRLSSSGHLASESRYMTAKYANTTTYTT